MTSLRTLYPRFLFIFLVTLLFPARLLAEDTISHEPLVLTKGGTPEEPVIYDGQGRTIDLGTDVTMQDWQRDGDVWCSNGPLPGSKPVMAGQLAGLFIDELPLIVPRDLAAEKEHPDRKSWCYVKPSELKPGEMGYRDDGSLYFRWPAGKQADTSKLILPPTSGVSAVTIACNYIIVRNLIVRYAANDGFNIHGKWKGVRLENVKAFSNADEGISAHDDVEMTVVSAEVAWNGSQAGGVADVNRCVTHYTNCIVHHNLGAAFHFSGKSHVVTDTLIHHQKKDFSVAKGTEFQQARVIWEQDSK